MTARDEAIRLRLRLGEDISWEFKQIKFSGNRPISPDRGDLADEIIAFANASGGTLLCGVTDDGQIQGMSREQMAALDHLLVDVSTDSIEPSVCIDIHRREVDGSAFLLVGVAKGDSLHEHNGRSLVRVGAAKRQMTADECLRLSQQRAQSRYVWFDEQPVLGTGFDTLDEGLWRPLLSAQGAAEPELALANLALLALDESGIQRATVAGLLLCSRHPERWLPSASIMATRYRGTDRSSGQVDAQEITGPLQRQIADAVAFAMRNMQVGDRKVPARIDMPQYSDKSHLRGSCERRGAPRLWHTR